MRCASQALLHKYILLRVTHRSLRAFAVAGHFRLTRLQLQAQGQTFGDEDLDRDRDGSPITHELS